MFEDLMKSNEPKRLTLALTNPNKKWVVKELDALIEEWRGWQEEVRRIPVPLRNPNYPIRDDVLADGEEKIQKHNVLQEKTLAFLENNIEGHGFIYGRDGTKIDRTDLRLDIRVKHRTNDLEVLRACIQYAKVPEAYWKATAKEMLEKVAGKGPELATDIAAKYLQGIM
jgi:hypothetical protein